MTRKRGSDDKGRKLASMLGNLGKGATVVQPTVATLHYS